MHSRVTRIACSVLVSVGLVFRPLLVRARSVKMIHVTRMSLA